MSRNFTDGEIIRLASRATLLITAIGMVVASAIGTGYALWIAVKAILGQ